MIDPLISPSKVSHTEESAISRSLLSWYDQKGRDLPWRRSDEPYRIWISEIMLQQTQVATVIPYYTRFIKRFPTVSHLARADLDEVLALWQGLGYYARARNLHRAAQIICEEHNKQLPDERETLLSLPGIGEYSVGAILSIAFGQHVAAVDGNVIRVLCRLYDYDRNPKSAQGKRDMQAMADGLLPADRVGDHNQAMMELGATICQPRSPQCGQCPIKTSCQSCVLGNQAQRPLRRPKRKIPLQRRVALLIERDGRLLIAQRPTEGLLGGLWEVPGAEITREEKEINAAQRCLSESLGAEGEIGEMLGAVEHAYTHFRVHVTVYAAHCETEPIHKERRTGMHWLAPEDEPDYGLTGVTRKILTKMPWAGSEMLL